MSNHDHLSNIGLHPAYDPDPAVHTPVRVEALRKRISDATEAVESYVGLQGQTVVVTVGRNIGEKPMPRSDWDIFRGHVDLTLQNLLQPDFSASYDGQGEWEGISEQSTTFVFSGVKTSVGRDIVTHVLADAAKRFGQDAIALTIGGTTLVAAS